MTLSLNKIIPVNKQILSSISIADSDVVIGFGHFNVIHPGHIRYLQYARSIGKKLVIALLGESLIDVSIRGEYFSEVDRAEGLASLHIVDKVYILNDIQISEFINHYKPKLFVLGKEYQKTIRNDILQAIKSLENFGGKPVYHAGEVHYASADLLHGSQHTIEEERRNHFSQTTKRQNIKILFP